MILRLVMDIEAEMQSRQGDRYLTGVKTLIVNFCESIHDLVTGSALSWNQFYLPFIE